MSIEMTATVIALACLAFAPVALADEAAPATQPAGPLGYTVDDIQGRAYDLSRHRGQVVLIVNVASKCGFTKQYAGLEALYREHAGDGLVIIGFPANNFGGQEPGTNEQIQEFCSTTYGVTFPMMSKISVKGDDKHPVYQHLTEQETAGEFAGEIEWNFTKFLVGRDGQIVARFPSNVPPEDPRLTGAVEKAMGEQ